MTKTNKKCWNTSPSSRRTNSSVLRTKSTRTSVAPTSPLRELSVRTNLPAAMSMECPVCYESEARCRFTCGHGFCEGCTKSWYMKGKSSCPMCRASMCFKGITKLKKEWYREKREETYVNLVTQMFDELMEEYDDIVLQCLEVVQNRYNYVMEKYPNVSCDALDLVLRLTWMDIEWLMNDSNKKVYEPKTYEKYLLVSKHGYVNRRHPYHNCLIRLAISP